MDYAAASVAEFLNLAKDGTFISVPAHIATSVIDGYKLANRNKRGAASLVKQTCDLMAPLVRAAASHSVEELGDLTEELNSLPRLLTEVQEGILQITGRGTFARFLKRGNDKQLIDDLNTKLRQRLQTFEVKGLINTQIQLNSNERVRREDHVQTHAALEKNQAEIHARFNQLQVAKAVVTRARPSPLLQTVSPYFTGRDSLVSQAVAAITDSSRPHISFFGAGGIGKTSMALAVAHHKTCVERFGDYRYFVECEAFTSASAVRSLILQVLAGSSNVPSEGDPRHLMAGMLSVDHHVLIILDNFETPWNSSGQRWELTELLKEMAAMSNVCMITTLRSDDAPASADVAWTRIPVQVLMLNDARDVFLSVNPTTSEADHDDLDRLLKAVDCLPLAIKLLAEVKKHQTCCELLQRWLETKTSLIKTERQDGTRLTSLNVSISLSLYSPLLDDVARKVLATICQLPVGVIGGRGKLKAMDLGVQNIDEKLDALLEVALLTDDRATDRLTMPPPIRAYVSSQNFNAFEDQLEAYYVAQIRRWDELSMGDVGYVDRQDALLAEADNIRHFLQHRLINHPSLKLGEAVYTFTGIDLISRPSMQLIACLTEQLTRIGWEKHRPHCMMRLGNAYIMLSKYTEAEDALQAARAQFVEIGDKLGTAECLQSLSTVHKMFSKYAEAELELRAARAQFVEIGNRRGAAQCQQWLGDVHALLSKYMEAEDALQAARAQFVEIGDKLGAAQCLLSLGNVHKMLSKYAEAEDELRAARAHFVEIGDKLGAARCLQWLGDVHRMFSKYVEAEDELQAARAQFVEIGDKLGAAQCLGWLGNLHVVLNKYREAEDALQEARALFVEIGDRLGTARCQQGLANVHKMLGKHTEAEDELQAARALFVEIGDRSGAAWCLHLLGDLHSMLSKYEEAENELQAARVQFVEIGDRFGAAGCLRSLAEIFRVQRRWHEVESLLAEAESIASSIGNRHEQALTYRCHGRLYKDQGRYEEARAQYVRSRDYFLSICFTADAEDVMREAEC